MNSHVNCFKNSIKNEQLKHPKHINGEPNKQGKAHLLAGSELKREKGSENSKMEAQE